MKKKNSGNQFISTKQMMVDLLKVIKKEAKGDKNLEHKLLEAWSNEMFWRLYA